jgi:hypothetical protein
VTCNPSWFLEHVVYVMVQQKRDEGHIICLVKNRLLMSLVMFVLATTLMTFIQGVTGTPYITGGDTPAGTDCSGLASWVANLATGRPAYGDRFHTANEESALLARGFEYGSGAPGDLVIGWNGGHTAVTLPDGTPVSSGEHGGVAIGGLGAYQKQFTHHMYLPISSETPDVAPDGPAPDAPAPELPAPEAVPAPELPAPEAAPAPQPIVVVVNAANPDALAPAPDSVI